jgi:S1-C subfamily serine protease
LQTTGPGVRVTSNWIGVEIQSVTPEIADPMGLKKAAGAIVVRLEARAWQSPPAS